MSKANKAWFVWCLLLALAACAKSAATPAAPSATPLAVAVSPRPAASATTTPAPPSPEPARTAEASAAASATPVAEFAQPSQTPVLPAITITLQGSSPTASPYRSFYQLLPPGQYVIRDPDEPTVISLDGKYQGNLVTGFGAGIRAFTLDGKQMAYIDHDDQERIIVFDLGNNSIATIPSPACYLPAWKPDGAAILVSGCDSTRLGGPSATYIVSLSNHSLTQFPDIGLWSRAVWSPDGKWIAYGRYGDSSNRTELKPYPGDGVYWTEAACLLNATTDCLDKTHGPLVPSAVFSMNLRLAWSPDSRYIAVVNHTEHSLHVIDIVASMEWTLVAPGEMGQLSGIGWSPDGEWLAVGRYADNTRGTFLISPWGKGERWLWKDTGPRTGFVLGWIKIPWPFRPNDVYTITTAGANLNLRAAPSLAGDVIRKLQPDEQITILEGPSKPMAIPGGA